MDKFLTVGKLKELLKDFSDEDSVVVVSSDLRYHLHTVSSVGHLISEYEPRPAIGLGVDVDSNIFEETDHCDKLLWTIKKEEPMGTVPEYPEKVILKEDEG